MRNEDDTELQNPNQWVDDENAIREPVKRRRAVVSVSFSREDFDRITDQAKSIGMKTSEFIREAALREIAPQEERWTREIVVSGPMQSTYRRQTEIGSVSWVKIEPRVDQEDYVCTVTV